MKSVFYFYKLLLINFALITIANTNEQSIKKALITGITGQDGSYLAELLLEKGYEVHGIKRRASLVTNTQRIDHLFEYKDRFFIHYGDLADSSNLIRLMTLIQPDEVYNLGAQSHVAVSFDTPEYTGDVTGIGTIRLLEAIRLANLTKKTKFYQASSSEMFGKVQRIPQDETTPFYPRSPYAAAKVYSYWATVNYRESYNMFACNGILFNHESPRRGETFVTRKITRAIANIAYKQQKVLTLGNLDAKRDWGYAKDYVEAMWLMLQQEKPEDYIIATNETHSVREFVELAFKEIGIEIEWKGSGDNEKGYDKNTQELYVEVNPKYYRPAEVDLLIGDATKAAQKLNWKPKITFPELVKIMVQEDFKITQKAIRARSL